MSYTDGGYRRPAWIPVVVGLALVFVFFRPSSCTQRVALTTPEGVERVLFEDPETSPLYKAIQRTYPEEFEGLKTDIIRRAKAGEATEQLSESVLTYVIEAGKRHRHDLAQAPHAAFDKYRSTEIRMIEAFKAADADLCATYMVKGAVRGPSVSNIPHAVLIDFRIASWEGNAAGRDHPVNRPIVQPTVADWRRVEQDMVKRGATPAMANAFLRGTISTANTADQCATGLTYSYVMNELPPEKADAMYAYLVMQQP